MEDKCGVNLLNDHDEMGGITIDPNMKVTPTATNIQEGYFKMIMRQEEEFRKKYGVSEGYRFYRFPNPRIESIDSLECIPVVYNVDSRRTFFFPKVDLGWWRDQFSVSWHLVYTEDCNGNGKIFPYSWIKDGHTVVE